MLALVRLEGVTFCRASAPGGRTVIILLAGSRLGRGWWPWPPPPPAAPSCRRGVKVRPTSSREGISFRSRRPIEYKGQNSPPRHSVFPCPSVVLEDVHLIQTIISDYHLRNFKGSSIFFSFFFSFTHIHAMAILEVSSSLPNVKEI